MFERKNAECARRLLGIEDRKLGNKISNKEPKKKKNLDSINWAIREWITSKVSAKHKVLRPR